MRTASPITITRDAPAGTEQVALIEVRAAAAVIENFLIALDAPPHLADASMNLARAFAEVRLIEWGVRS